VPETGIPRALHSSRSSVTLRDEKSVEESEVAGADLAAIDFGAAGLGIAESAGFAATMVEVFGFGVLRRAMMMQSR
jgi:hypothetical protein